MATKFILEQKKPTKPMQIIYHGTRSKANAKSIVKHGFRPGTYFGIHMEDALGYGGKYLFEIAIESNRIPKGVEWEFCNDEVIPPSNIVSLTQYNPEKKIIENEAMRNKVFQSNIQVDIQRGTPKVKVDRIPTRKTSTKITRGVGYGDKNNTRLSRRRRKGFKKVRFT